ncbi:MAG: hypothetical protein IJ230_03615 [Clostridia bacterium]|nr:hypothetical protein [Clostridia bacterium]
MARNQKLGLKDLRYSGKFILASVIVEGLLLAPKTKVQWNGREVEIGGVIPMLQKEIAAGVRDGMNAVLPTVAARVEAAVRQTGVKEQVMEKVLWFVYDYMEQFTLNSVTTTVMERANLHVNEKMTGLFRDYLQEVLDSKDDREKLIFGITDFLLNSAATIFQGTSVESFLTGGLRNNIKLTVADYVDRGLQTENGAILVDRLLGAVEQFETLTLASFLERNLDLPRPAFEKFLSDLYEKYLGTEMVAYFSNLELSSKVYRQIAGMDYDAVFRDITKNRWQDLVRVTLSAASVGLYITNVSNKMDARDEKKRSKKQAKIEKKGAKKAAKKAAKKSKRK